jgi:trk system potassium uptake protein TrkH
VSSYREFLILRYKAIFRNVGNITIGLSLLILAISFFALINDGNKLFFSFFIPAILTFLTGLFFRIISRGERKKELSIHDATVTVFLVWSLAIFLSSLPFIFANYLNFTQAIFERAFQEFFFIISVKKVDKTIISRKSDIPFIILTKKVRVNTRTSSLLKG